MNNFLRVSLLCSAALAGGCVVGPEYHKPEPVLPRSYVYSAPMPTTAPSTQASVTTSDPAKLAAWWEKFNDPVLNGLVLRAMSENLDLQQATERLREARAQRGVIGGAQLPEVSGNGSYLRSGSGGGGPTFSRAANGAVIRHDNASRQSRFQYGLDATWELDVFGGVRRSVEAADATVVAAVEDRRDVLVSVIAEVAVDYIALRGYQEQIRIARENVAAQERTAEVTRKKFANGFVSRLDVANANAQVYNTQSDIPALQALEQQHVYALGILLGQEPQAMLEDLSMSRPIPPTPPVVPVGLPAELLRRRPDIRRAEAQLHAATATVGVATSQLYPQFTLAGSLNISANKIRGLGNWASNAWDIGPSVSWPIFSGGRLLANIDVQNALQRQAAINYRRTVLVALQDVENAMVAYGKEQDRRNLLVKDVAEVQVALDVATRLYNTGQTDFLNVLNAERSLFGAQTALTQANVNIATDLAALYKALGGGWETDAGPTTRPKPSLAESMH